MITDAIRDRLSDPVSISTEWPDQFGENYSWALRNNVDIPGSNMSPPSNFFGVSPRRFDAVKVEEQGVKITVVGGHSKPVIITNLKARIFSTAPPVSGTLLYAIPQGSSPLLRVGIDLNDLNPSARSINERGQLADRYFEGNSITLNRGETQSISVDVRASRTTFTWDLQMDILDGGKSKTITIDMAGHPVELTGCAPSYGRVYLNYSSEWKLGGDASMCPKPRSGI
ncbi:hypothetical protein K7711_20630 [Nocardia sp. CA2R105]|uniref:hypothetical protein n=1 Tax=Nocardia coffeae TaxID=2873381 RepID=UPI001CA73A3D|nr:hypothetical protein [Nocardia coffeae]MBY8858891.1 hypothetical protein [Nocardia coffeae]